MIGKSGERIHLTFDSKALQFNGKYYEKCVQHFLFHFDNEYQEPHSGHHRIQSFNQVRGHN